MARLKTCRTRVAMRRGVLKGWGGGKGRLWSARMGDSSSGPGSSSGLGRAGRSLAGLTASTIANCLARSTGSPSACAAVAGGVAGSG